MYHGDQSRKRTLVDHGFRLPSALDNRPLKWEEFKERVGQTVYLSATPGQIRAGTGRRRGSADHSANGPRGSVRAWSSPRRGRSTTSWSRCRLRVERDERVLVTTLTKKMAEDLTEYLADRGVRVEYLHSDVDTLRRVELLRELRMGRFDVLVGINLLREGLDLPEVSLVSILDADKEGFLRSGTSLIQTIGRAARNVSGEVHMYADIDHRLDAHARSTRPTAAATCRSPTTRRTASTPRRCASASATSPRCSRARRRTPQQTLKKVAKKAPTPSARGTPMADRPPRNSPSSSRTCQPRCARPRASLQFELAARLRDEIGELKKELRQMLGRSSWKAQ